MRSKLFVPGSRPDLFDKAMASQADALSFDLEDAVAPTRKQEARSALAYWLASPGFAAAQALHPKKIIVRVNAADTPYFAADLDALGGLPIDLLNLPKVESVTALCEAAGQAIAAGFQNEFLITVETPRALASAAELAAAHPRVAGLQLGLADLFEPLGIDRYQPETLRAVMLSLRLGAGCAGKYAMDAAYARVRDAEGFRAEAKLARSLGFLGKSCVHPSQIAIANEVFGFSAEEVAEAERIVSASREQDGVGAFLLDGKMIDAPFVQRARDVLLAAGRAA
ncbi:MULTISPECIES: HpcH/HpaI aldolase/citrate lyase family protein [Achromobacter]|uniref:CoA ester lyase n=1 Tax=Achromobacter spanius TaxID=217203 RepID=A0ABY8GPS0_9BURK|nr:MULTISPECIES: CoA ester lyase [Achromobacter]WAI83915.1 CoA ester lyase [Achromobacter spanius]WEX93995.1 CoA ester lyase [Achromobacter sp. SS2-2022]WFP06840.1 CoA ester lyase [Achromobacter spanius]